MIGNLYEFEHKEPELVLSWNDKETEAKGWLVINSLKGGAAGGGTRMKKGIDFQEVLLLAKTMEIKFTIAGPSIGGAKSGIDFDPFDSRKRGVLERWYKAISPMLRNCYGTGGDLNVDLITEVIPITRQAGILHPQEGILRGHYGGDSVEQRAAQLSAGVGKIVEDNKYSPEPGGSFTVADLVSGYSVAETIVHYYRIKQDSLEGKRAIIQGWGNVGSSAGYFLSQVGVKIIGITDINGCIINEKGFEPHEVRSFMLDRKTKRFSGYQQIPYNELNSDFWNLPAEIFVPAAASNLVTQNQVEMLLRNGIELIACGANVPFADNENFFGEIAEYTDNKVSIIPDFIANCGMARAFAYLMQENAAVSDEAIFNDISNTVGKALTKVCEGGMKTRGIAQAVYQDALDHID